MPTALIIVDHGSRRQEANEMLEGVAEVVGEIVDEVVDEVVVEVADEIDWSTCPSRLPNRRRNQIEIVSLLKSKGIDFDLISTAIWAAS